jgi:hypothetical protein
MIRLIRVKIRNFVLFMKDELDPPFLEWPKIGFSEWWHRQHSGLCRFCEDGEHAGCLDSTEEWNECSCASVNHTL